jgi:hypothetical protein
MMPYPSFSDPRHLGTTYSIDGIIVLKDSFMSDVEAHFPDGLGFALMQMSARASTRIVGYKSRGVSWETPFEETYDEHGRLVNRDMGAYDSELRTVSYSEASPIYNSDWGFSFALLTQTPQNPTPSPRAQQQTPIYCQPDVIKAMERAWTRTSIMTGVSPPNSEAMQTRNASRIAQTVR